MTLLRPFFLLIARASVFWIGALTLLWLSVVVVGLAQPEARPVAALLDPGLIALVGYPAAAGWLFGGVIQEFQHTSFAYQLPRVRPRLAFGFVMAGLVVAALTVGLVSSVSSLGLPLMFALSCGAYCAAGVLLDPLSRWVTGLNALVLLVLTARSQDVAGFAGDHPWPAALISCGVGTWGLRRLFARSTFRRKPGRPTKPLPGRFALERSQDYERQKQAQRRAQGTAWRAGYLGPDSWPWVRAAIHETYGGLGRMGLVKAINGAWGLLLLVLLSAWIDKGEFNYVEAVGRSLYDALFRSPHVAPFGQEGGPYGMVLIVIAAAGLAMALLRPVALSGAVFHPLSRLQRARVDYRGGLVDAAILTVGVGLTFFVIGHGVGWLIGFEPRFDFMPYYFRVLLVTLILMPLGHWGRLHLGEATRRRTGNTLVGLVFGFVGFVFIVAVCTSAVAAIITSPLVELIVLTMAWAASQRLYWTGLTGYYQRADLA